MLDLTECSFLDSSAVRVILATAAERERAGGSVAVVAPDAGIRKPLEIARVDAVLPLHSALAEML